MMYFFLFFVLFKKKQNVVRDIVIYSHDMDMIQHEEAQRFCASVGQGLYVVSHRRHRVAHVSPSSEEAT